MFTRCRSLAVMLLALMAISFVTQAGGINIPKCAHCKRSLICAEFMWLAQMHFYAYLQDTETLCIAQLDDRSEDEKATALQKALASLDQSAWNLAEASAQIEEMRGKVPSSELEELNAAFPDSVGALSMLRDAYQQDLLVAGPYDTMVVRISYVAGTGGVDGLLQEVTSAIEATLLALGALNDTLHNSYELLMSDPIAEFQSNEVLRANLAASQAFAAMNVSYNALVYLEHSVLGNIQR